MTITIQPPLPHWLQIIESLGPVAVTIIGGALLFHVLARRRDKTVAEVHEQRFRREHRARTLYDLARLYDSMQPSIRELLRLALEIDFLKRHDASLIEDRLGEWDRIRNKLCDTRRQISYRETSEHRRFLLELFYESTASIADIEAGHEVAAVLPPTDRLMKGHRTLDEFLIPSIIKEYQQAVGITYSSLTEQQETDLRQATHGLLSDVKLIDSPDLLNIAFDNQDERQRHSRVITSVKSLRPERRHIFGDVSHLFPETEDPES